MTVSTKPFFSENSALQITEWSMPLLLEKVVEDRIEREAHERIRQEQELTTLKENAYKEAFSQGEKAGFETGKNQVDTIIERLSTIEKQLANPLNCLTDDVYNLLQNIVITLTQALLFNELSNDSQKIEKILREVVTNLNDTSSKISIQCAPSDVEIVQKYFVDHVDNKMKLESNEAITTGGFIISTENSYLDATTEHRMKQLIDHYFIDSKDDKNGAPTPE
jgi:flagellar biosynthesis/type III secretory pathway protein FliH